MHNVTAAQQQPPQTQCPAPCCSGTELLCISIPCPIEVVLLGGAIDLTVNLPCLQIGSTNPLTDAQLALLLGLLRRLLGGLTGGGTGTAAAEAAAEA
jgi:hypothetical protein